MVGARRLLSAAIALAWLIAPLPGTGAAQAAGCAEGQAPAFSGGFAALHARLRGEMGTPTTCEYPDPAGSGDMLQATTIGLARWRRATNTPTFTSAGERWALTANGLTFWTDDTLDPPPAALTPSKPYSAAATWDWLHHDDIPPGCGVRSWLELAPDRGPAPLACLVAGMRADGAGDQAVQFLEADGQFLAELVELGRVDYGVASAAWFNMGRGELVFLNGDPPVLHLAAVVPSDGEWQVAPGYPELLRAHPGLFPWPQYALVVGNRAAPGGGQRVSVEVSLQACRVCGTPAFMPVSYTFDAAGRLVGHELGPPMAPSDDG